MFDGIAERNRDAQRIEGPHFKILQSKDMTIRVWAVALHQEYIKTRWEGAC
jgi:hypothetical protein